MNERTGQLINVILALILIVGIALTVYAVNKVRSIDSEAKGKPTSGEVAAEKCSIVKDGERINVGETKTYTVTTCEGPATTFLVATYAGSGFKFNAGYDIALRITYPDSYVFNPGMVQTVDRKGYVSESTFATFCQYVSSSDPCVWTPIEGTWKIEVTNTGTKTASYDFRAGFVYNQN